MIVRDDSAFANWRKRNKKIRKTKTKEKKTSKINRWMWLACYWNWEINRKISYLLQSICDTWFDIAWYGLMRVPSRHWHAALCVHMKAHPNETKTTKNFSISSVFQHQEIRANTNQRQSEIREIFSRENFVRKNIITFDFQWNTFHNFHHNHIGCWPLTHSMFLSNSTLSVWYFVHMQHFHIDEDTAFPFYRNRLLIMEKKKEKKHFQKRVQLKFDREKWH